MPKTLEEMQVDSKDYITQQFKAIESEIDRNGYLDHAIRAFEELTVKRLTAEERERAQKTKSKVKKVVFKIGKFPSDKIPSGAGTIIRHEGGMDILYPQMQTQGGYMGVKRLDSVFAIAHELGHAVLGHLIEVGMSSRDIKDTALENRASFFGKLVIKQRSARYNDENYRKEHTFTDAEMDAAIKRIHLDYSEEWIQN